VGTVGLFSVAEVSDVGQDEVAARRQGVAERRDNLVGLVLFGEEVQHGD
jgi:hypothetical protein